MPTARSLRKPSLLAGCALGALLLALPGEAAAQRAFEGAPTVVAGAAGITTAPGYTLIVPTTPQVVINWEPLDNVGLGTIDFLPAGTLAEFAEVTGTFDYTVLNRILPVDPAKNPVNRVVQFNGTVFSRVGNFPGGDIWFYSPTGIIAGPTAVFNVGSLILTTNDIPFVIGVPSPLYGPGGLVQLQGPAGSTGFVEIQGGAQITASAGPFGPAYVALVAPRIVQAGQVSSNGTIGYLAAEQVDMTINGGLFDFTLTVGTTDANGVVHTGTTTGPASTSAADLQRLSIAVLPKNAALTMLLAGAIGYTPAAVAANEGSSVVLSAGFATDDPTVVPVNRFGNIDIGTTAFTNRLTGYATDAIDVAPGVTTSFGGATSLFAVNAIDLTSVISTSITAASTLSLFAGQPGIGGAINLDANGGGQITAAGGFALNAGGDAATYDTLTTFVDAAGGTINIVADGGTISTPLNFVADVGATAGFDPALGGQGGGGTIDVLLDNNGVIGADTMILTALGRGGSSDDTGGNGIGGTVVVTENGGQLNLVSMRLFAQGAGGDAAVRAGDGSGGSVNVDLFDQAQDIDNVYLDASASTGLPTAPGGVSGHASSAPDAVRLSVVGSASLDVLNVVELNADARSGIEVAAGLGGQAGGVTLEAVDGGSITAGSVDLHADTLLRGDAPNIVPTNSPIQQGGLVAVLVDGPGSSIDTQGFGASASATGHEATVTAGSATGGTAQVIVSNAGSLTVSNGAGDALLRVVAEGYGGPGPVAADAFGGTARLVLEDGSIDVLGDIEVSATGESPELAAATGGDGFDATGGNASLELLTGLLGTASLNANNVTVAANGDARVFTGVFLPAGDPIQGNGGDGLGGTAGVLIEAGTLATGLLLVESAGTGGASAATDAATPLTSGNGTGGTTQFVQSGGTGSVTTLQLDSTGRGGGGAPDATGANLAALSGDGIGGNATAQLDGGTLTAADTAVLALGTGGPGMNHTGAGTATDGGAGTGGAALLQMPAGGTADFTTAALRVIGNGQGGDGGVSTGGTSGQGGDGTATSATVNLADSTFSLGMVTVEANGFGGAGEPGGIGSGGVARFALIDSAAGPVGARSLDSLLVDASGFGGFGFSGPIAPSNAGSLTFAAQVLDPASALTVAGDLYLFSVGSNAAPGIGIDATISGAPLIASGNVAMSTSRDLTLTATQPFGALGTLALNARAIDVTGALQAGTSLELFSVGGDIAADNLTAGTWAFVQSAGGATLGDLTAGTDAGASTFAGNLTVGEVTAGDEIWLSVFGTDPTRLLTAGTLTSTGLGDDTLAGPPTLFVGAGPTGNVTRVRSSGSLAVGAVQTPGRAILVADFGTIDSGQIDAPEGVILLGRGDIALPGATTAGPFYVADSAMFLPNLPDAYDPASLDGVPPVDTSGGLTVTGTVDAGSVSVAVGGNATFATLNSGGTTFLRASGGALNIDDLLSAGAVTALARSIDIASTGALNFADLEATAGSLTVVTAGGLDLATADATGAITLRSTGGAITATGDVVTGGSATVEGADGVTLPFLRSGGTTLLDSGGTVDVDTLVSIGNVAVTGNAVDIGGSGDLTFTTAQATDTLAIVTTGDLALAAVSAGNALTLESTLGSLTATGNVTGGATTLTAADDILLAGDLTAAGALAATAGGSFTVQGAATADATSIVAPGGITLASLDTGGSPLFQADGGTIAIAELLTFGQITARGRAIDIASTGGLFFGEATATAGDIVILASGELVTNMVTATGLVDLRTTNDYMRAVGTVTGGTVQLTAFDRIEANNLISATSLTVDAGASFILSGTARGTTVTVTSANIDLGAAARIGERGTTDDITLVNRTAANVMFIGGAASATGYSLDQAEAARLFADDSIEFASGGNVEVRDLALTFGANGNIGGGGTLEISTPQQVLITGDVALTTSGADDTFLIDPTLVELDSTTGSIALLDGTGNPLGRLHIVGDTIAVASTNALTQLRTLNDMTAINALLDTPGGTGLPMRAGTILIDADDAFFVQNSGASTAFADRRGFAAGGLEITTGSAATRIAVNGQILTPGGAVSGLNTAPLIRINGAVPAAGGQFDARSTINGCVIGANCLPPPPDPGPQIPDFNPPTSEDVDPIPPAEGLGALFVAPLIELAGTEPLITPPLVDEPITGVGNDDLWEPRCDPAEEEDGVCPEEEREP